MLAAISLDQLAPIGHARGVDRADLDEIEFRRVLGPPFANGRTLRDAVEVIVNGARLSELLDGAPVDVVEVRSGFDAAWMEDGRSVLVSRCGCGDVDCTESRVDIQRRGDVVMWSVGAIARTFRFEAAEMARSLQVALAENR
jgi:hypothetical protein